MIRLKGGKDYTRRFNGRTITFGCHEEVEFETQDELLGYAIINEVKRKCNKHVITYLCNGDVLRDSKTGKIVDDVTVTKFTNIEASRFIERRTRKIIYPENLTVEILKK